MSVQDCLNSFEVIPVDRRTLEVAALLPGRDFEDNVTISCALLAAMDVIVTRDAQGFVQSAVASVSPASLVSQLGLP